MSDINTTDTVSISQDYTNNYRNQMQESLIDAINILYKGAVAKENISKTLECIISDASERDKGIYKVDYMKNIFEVSCPLSTLYDVGDAVFVLVPDGDFSKTKIIVGSAEGNTGGSSGTDVEANPTGTATDILEKLRVGTTIYSVEGGSTDVVTDVKVNGASVVGSDHVARISAVTQAQLENALETKADVTDLTDLEETVNDLITTVSGKANQSSLEALTTIVRTKANSADVNAALNLKANQSDLNDLATIVDSKANQSEVTAIKDGAIIDSFGDVENALTSKQDTLAFDNVPTQNSNNPVKSGGVYIALASKANTSDLGTAAAKNFTTSVTDGSNDLVTSGAVYTAIDNLPEPMVFKGSLGTGGTITTLPVDGTATKGDTYKVITAGTYASKAAKVGDTFICLTKTSSANTWELIPSGDEPSGTVTSVTLKATSPIAIDSSSAITTSGTRTLSHANSGATAGSYGDSGNQTPGYGSTFKVPYVTVNATGHVTAISEHTVKIPASDNTNTTYTFTNGTNQFTVTPSGGSAQTVKVTPNDTTKLPLAGGNMTGQILTSFKSAVAMGSRQSDATTIENLCNELRYSSGCAGSVATTAAYTKDGVTIPAGWYNYLWIPHRSGGVNGNASGDNCNYGSLLLSGMTLSGCYMLRYASSKISELKDLYADTKYTAATVAPGAIAASGSAGTSTNYARQDHTHGISVATGDANGQVKIAGQNVSVKGLGSAAYTTSTAYVASMNGTHTGELKLFREGTTNDNVSTRLIFSNKNTTTGSTSTGYIDAFNGGANGTNMVIRPGGNLFVGSGESATNHFNAGFAQSTGEVLYIDSDNQIHLQANAQTIANRVGAQIDTSGNIIPEKADVATNNIGGIGTSTYKWANGYFTNINGVAVGTPKFTDASVYQTATESSNWRKVVLGIQNDSASGQAVVATTDKVYVSPSLEFQPSTGTLKAKKFDGPATSAAKLTTSRTITLGGDLDGSANFDGSGNITISGASYWCSVNSGNKANYPWHRIAYVTDVTGTYNDRDAIFAIRRKYNDGPFGLIKVSLRTNGSDAACTVNARWLYRCGFAANDVVIAHWGTTGQSVYADIFLKCGTYARTTVYQEEGDRQWTLVNSNEVNNTTATDKLTSTEVYKDVATAATEIHGKAYTSTKDAIDAATVNYANDAGTVNGKTVAVDVPSNAKFSDTTYTASTTSIGSASAGTAIAADDITAWSAGTVPSLTITSTACDDITAWSAGTMTSASYSKGVLTITNGSKPSLSYTARSVGSASEWNAGTAPSLSYTARSIPNISVSSKTVVTGIIAD